MTYDEALNLILNKQSLGIKPGLSRIRNLLDILGNPQDKIKIIHIAGTNGKGTVANTIANALMQNGLNVGLFTSPWIFDYREQIQINNEFIDKEFFTEFTERYSQYDATEFEFVTAMMYAYFAQMKVDYAVVECGMGGRGDATNVEKENICAVLTSISIDHTDFLGDTIEKITAEKEGVIRDVCFRYRDTGDIDADNLSLAKKVVSYLGFCDDIPIVKPSARQQKIGNILLDGGHNPEAGKALAPLINNETAVIAMMKDKDVDGYLSYVASKCRKIICTDVDNPRAMDAYELLGYAKKYCCDVSVITDCSAAVKQDGVSLICGSFYLIREIINLIL